MIGHEVAHALARHGAERMSQGMAAAGRRRWLSPSPPADSSAGDAAGDHEAYGLGAQVGVALPFSRSQESEADHIGLILMAKAGYDPEAAIGLWQRMEQSAGGKGPPEWLSTHPSPATRSETSAAGSPRRSSTSSRRRRPTRRCRRSAAPAPQRQHASGRAEFAALTRCERDAARELNARRQ